MATAFHLQHEECRDRVCVCCYRKASRSLSTAEVVDIQNYLIEGYDINHADFPKGICTGCSIALAKKRNEPDYNPVKGEDYDPKRVRGLRSSSVCCDVNVEFARLQKCVFWNIVGKLRKSVAGPKWKQLKTNII